MICRICGEEKPPEEFNNIPYFTKYKKHRVVWCRCCQKMYIEQKKEKEHQEKLMRTPKIFTVSFT